MSERYSISDNEIACDNPAQKHTPGPWAFRKFGTWVLVSDYGPRGVVLGATLDKGMPHLVQRDPDGVLCEFDPGSPDARLIAAAPEMLEALRGALSQLDCFVPGNPAAEYCECLSCIAARRATAAIAKAEVRP